MKNLNPFDILLAAHGIPTSNTQKILKEIIPGFQDTIDNNKNQKPTMTKEPVIHNHYGKTDSRTINMGDGNYNENIKGDYIQQQGSFGVGVNKGEIKAKTIAGTINEAQSKTLAETAAEIQQLLEQLSQTYPTSTSKEKMTVVGEVVDRIEKNPTLKARVINALKAGGTEAFKEAIDHPLVNILTATVEGWQEAE
ncbi:MAG: hypothetical protein QNJ54_06660 [Prochloraceae cyanobacterium]|nr:hypothetical protein [Prochloraceae cyanobacterium]